MFESRKAKYEIIQNIYDEALKNIQLTRTTYFCEQTDKRPRFENGEVRMHSSSSIFCCRHCCVDTRDKVGGGRLPSACVRRGLLPLSCLDRLP